MKNDRSKFLKKGRYLDVHFKNIFINDSLEIIKSYSGEIIGKTDAHLELNVSFDQKIQKINGTNSSEEIIHYTDYEEYNNVKIDLKDIDYVSYETPMTFISYGITGVSVLTALFVAPAISYNYSNGTFRADRYRNTMKFALVGIAIGIPMTYIFNSKKLKALPDNIYQ